MPYCILLIQIWKTTWPHRVNWNQFSTTFGALKSGKCLNSTVWSSVQFSQLSPDFHISSASFHAPLQKSGLSPSFFLTHVKRLMLLIVQVTHKGWDCRVDETPVRTHAPIYWPLRDRFGLNIIIIIILPLKFMHLNIQSELYVQCQTCCMHYSFVHSFACFTNQITSIISQWSNKFSSR